MTGVGLCFFGDGFGGGVVVAEDAEVDGVACVVARNEGC